MTAAKHDTAEDLARAHLIGYLEKSYPAPRATQGGQAAAMAVPRAAALVCAVRDEGAESLAEVLDPLTRDQLYAVAVTLAAMVDPDQPVGDLLGWVADIGVELERTYNRENWHRYGKARREAAA
jgi:hypothetical protein